MTTTAHTTKKARPTLEQRRARDAWERSNHCSGEYKNLAKGLSALIMGSGLMQVMAFLHEKGSRQSQHHCEDVAGHLRAWLHKRFPKRITDDDFKPFMEALMGMEPRAYQEVTTEALAWLRWLRQMAAARVGGE